MSIYWEMAIPTAAPIGVNKPDIVIKGKDEELLGDVSVPLDRNILRRKQFHGSRQTRFLYIEAEFSASVGMPPPFKDQGADAAPKEVGGE